MKFFTKERFARIQALVAMNPKLWKMPRFRAGSKKYPHHSDKECARRRGQKQHHKQVFSDMYNKKWPSA